MRSKQVVINFVAKVSYQTISCCKWIDKSQFFHLISLSLTIFNVKAYLCCITIWQDRKALQKQCGIPWEFFPQTLSPPSCWDLLSFLAKFLEKGCGIESTTSPQPCKKNSYKLLFFESFPFSPGGDLNERGAGPQRRFCYHRDKICFTSHFAFLLSESYKSSKHILGKLNL